MVAGLPKVLGRGALSIAASVRSDVYWNPCNKHKTQSAFFGDRNNCTCVLALSPGGANGLTTTEPTQPPAQV